MNLFSSITNIQHTSWQMASRYWRSVSSKVASSLLSMSSTATTSPACEKTGTTISDLERLLQAICPGNCSTSGTTMVSLRCQAVPRLRATQKRTAKGFLSFSNASASRRYIVQSIIGLAPNER